MADQVAVHILHTPMREFKREQHDVLFCFNCREYRQHWWVVYVEVEPGYYGPYGTLECDRCGRDHTRMDGQPRLQLGE